MTIRSTCPLECFCGRTYSKPIDLEEHRRARGHFPSHVCNRLCKHPPVGQYDVRIRKCGSCGKVCERLDILEDHRIATGHCFCSECDIPFESQSASTKHRETEVHASEFRCCNCDISFKDIHALNAHMASRAHRKPLKEESHQKTSKAKKAKKSIAPNSSDRSCKQCQRTFKSSQALQQHCESIKHKPLSALGCPVGKGCRGNFSAPSSLLHHLESGNCESGMDRYDIYHMVQLCDKDRKVHNVPTITPSSSAALSVGNLTPRSGPSLMSLETSHEWSLVSTTLSQGSVDGSWVELSPLRDSFLSCEGRVMDDKAVEHSLRCPLCPKTRKPFITTQALQQHMGSPVHGNKIYHCPSNLRAVGSRGSEKKGKKERQFTTLGGLAQHLESEACYGGKQTFLYCIDLIQRHLVQWGFGGMQLLLPGSQS
ncbi:hypothetical protein GQ44DRAFT_782742 [Phaeosphaeriaceae sp. PMI808]|nr:hypothetical protein GQ44DRAFT_782742 [Phaeosphaeriaceae sp. PMI808]